MSEPKVKSSCVEIWKHFDKDGNITTQSRTETTEYYDGSTKELWEQFDAENSVTTKSITETDMSGNLRDKECSYTTHVNDMIGYVDSMGTVT